MILCHDKTLTAGCLRENSAIRPHRSRWLWRKGSTLATDRDGSGTTDVRGH